MIKFLIPLFVFVPLYSQGYTYLFPDHHTRFIHEISRLIKKSSSVVIIGNQYHHPSLSKAIIASAKKESAIKLILNDPKGEPLSLIQYGNIDLFLSSIPLKQTVIIIDSTLACSTSVPIDEDLFSSRPVMLHCTDSSDEIRRLDQVMQPLIHASRKYLE